MWPWQLNVPKRYHLVLKTLAYSTIAHLFVLALFFIIYRGGTSGLNILVGKNINNARVVLLPLYKIAPAFLKNQSAAQRNQESASAVAAQEALVEEKKEKKRAATTLAHNKRNGSKAKKKKQSKVASKKKKKKEARKVETKEKKRAESEPMEEIKPVAPAHVESQVAPGENVVYAGQLEYEALKIQEQLQTEVERCWQSPPGVSGLNCKITVVLDFAGKPHTIDVASTSGALMYDLSARQAVETMAFPASAWGKEITITFTC